MTDKNMQTELVKAGKARVWGLAAVANFMLGGAGAGLYLLMSVRLIPGAGLSGTAGLLPAVLAGLGFFSVSLESGRPWRGMYLLSNLRNSWMSIEVLSGALFITAVVLDRFASSPVLRTIAACAAFELIVSHGFILYQARAMSAWNVPAIPFLFLSSAMVLGGGLLLMLNGLQGSALGAGTIKIVLVCLLADFAVWGLYVWFPRGPAFRSATSLLRRPIPLFFVAGLGHLFPLVLLMWPASAGSRPVILLTGLCMLIGGAAQKILIILGTDLFRSIISGQPRRSPFPGKEHLGKT